MIQDILILAIIAITYFFDSIRDSSIVYSYHVLSPLAKKLSNSTLCRWLAIYVYTKWNTTQWAYHIVKWIATYPIAITLTIIGLSHWILWIIAMIIAWLSFRFGTYVSGGKFFGSWFLR